MIKLILPALLALLFGCANTSTEVAQEDHSGYLTAEQHGQLKEESIGEDGVIYRWISPRVTDENYNKVIIDPIVFFPAPQVGEQAQEAALQEIADELTTLMRSSVSEVMTLAEAPDPMTLRAAIAITGLKISTEGMRGWEVLPVTAVIGALTAHPRPCFSMAVFMALL